MKRAIVLLLCFVASCSNPYYRGPVSDHFDGKKFHNYGAATIPQHTWLKTIKWIITGRKAKWPQCCISAAPLKLDRRVYGNRAVVTYLNHATTLIQVAGLNILTDPVWYKRASPFQWVGPQRINEMPLTIKELPPIHVILLSHNHYDHLDLSALKKLVALYKPKIFTGLGTDNYLKNKGISSIGMDWWTSEDVGTQVRITYTPSQHWSSRWGWDKNYMLWGSFMVDVAGLGQIYFGADTGYNSVYFKKIRAKFPNIRLALLPIGAYKPRWFMEYAHVSPAQAVKMALDLNSQQNIAIQHDSFNLANEEYGEAPKDLATALRAMGKKESYFKALKPGQSVTIN